jgi:hypothetical protein
VRRARVEEAIVGGFFVRPDGTPLGEVRTRGVARRHVPFTAPYDATRACVHVVGGVASIAARDTLPPAPRGDLLQAGPLLVAHGEPMFRREDDCEGFSAATPSSTPTSPTAATRARPSAYQRRVCWRSPSTAARATTPV